MEEDKREIGDIRKTKRSKYDIEIAEDTQGGKENRCLGRGQRDTGKKGKIKLSEENEFIKCTSTSVISYRQLGKSDLATSSYMKPGKNLLVYQ